MTLPKSHFYVRTINDAFPNNPGSHPILAVNIADGLAVVAACSTKDKFSKKVARSILDGRQKTGMTFSIAGGKDTLETILKRAGVPRKLLRVADMTRGEAAFERALEA